MTERVYQGNGFNRPSPRERLDAVDARVIAAQKAMWDGGTIGGPASPEMRELMNHAYDDLCWVLAQYESLIHDVEFLIHSQPLDPAETAEHRVDELRKLAYDAIKNVTRRVEEPVAS